MGIRKEEKHGLELSLGEEIRKELHSVGPDASHVLVLTRILLPECLDSIFYVIRYFHPYFHS